MTDRTEESSVSALSRSTSSGREAASALSIDRGIPLSEEPGLGALTLPGFLREVTNRNASREALVMHTPEGVERWTYATLWDRSLEVARALIACGAGKDSRVGILMTNRPEWIAGVFGTALAGGVAVTISTFSTAPELDYMLQASGVSDPSVRRPRPQEELRRDACAIWSRRSDRVARDS